MPPTETTPEARPPRRALVYLARLAVIACLLVACWYTLRSYFRLLESNPPRDVADEDDPGAMLDTLTQLPAGTWQLGEQPWRLRVTGVTAEQVEEHLRRPPTKPVLAAWSAAEGMLLGLVKQSARRRTGEGELTIYGSDTPEMRWRAYSRRHEGRERLLAGRVAFVGPDGSWQVVEITPDAGERRGSSPPSGQLLPWPAGCQQLAARRDDEGRLLAEMVWLNGSLGELDTALRRDGWQAGAPGPVREYRRRARAVQVWATAPPRGGRPVVLALRSSIARP